MTATRSSSDIGVATRSRLRRKTFNDDAPERNVAYIHGHTIYATPARRPRSSAPERDENQNSANRRVESKVANAEKDNHQHRRRHHHNTDNHHDDPNYSPSYAKKRRNNDHGPSSLNIASARTTIPPSSVFNRLTNKFATHASKQTCQNVCQFSVSKNRVTLLFSFFQSLASKVYKFLLAVFNAILSIFHSTASSIYKKMALLHHTRLRQLPIPRMPDLKSISSLPTFVLHTIYAGGKLLKTVCLHLGDTSRKFCRAVINSTSSLFALLWSHGRRSRNYVISGTKQYLIYKDARISLVTLICFSTAAVLVSMLAALAMFHFEPLRVVVASAGDGLYLREFFKIDKDGNLDDYDIKLNGINGQINAWSKLFTKLENRYENVQ